MPIFSSMHVGSTAIASMVILTGCYTSVQRTSHVAATDSESVSTDLYEFSGGISFSAFDLYTGYGAGPQRVHPRSTAS